MGHFDDLARSADSDGLRALRDELRAEQEIGESEAAKQYLRRLTVADVAAEVVQSGDRVRIRVGHLDCVGLPAGVAGTALIVEVDSGARLVADLRCVRLDVVERSASGGRPVEPRRAESFQALLRLMEVIGHNATIVTTIADEPIDGRISVVGSDHVRIADGERDIVIPLACIAAVLTRSDGPYGDLSAPT